MEPNDDNDDDTYDSSKTSPAVNLSVKERIQMMQRMTDAKKPSPPLMTSGMVQQQQQQQQTSLTSKVGAMETTPRQLTPSFESAEEDDAKTKKTKVKKVVATPLPKYTPYRKEREEEEEKKEEFQTASALIRQRSAPQSVTTTTPAFLSNIPRSPQRSPRSPTFRDRTQMFEQQPVASVSQRQAQMLKNLRLKIQANIEKSEEIARTVAAKLPKRRFRRRRSFERRSSQNSSRRNLKSKRKRLCSTRGKYGQRKKKKRGK
jgi:hypothetical protein